MFYDCYHHNTNSNDAEHQRWFSRDDVTHMPRKWGVWDYVF